MCLLRFQKRDQGGSRTDKTTRHPSDPLPTTEKTALLSSPTTTASLSSLPTTGLLSSTAPATSMTSAAKSDYCDTPLYSARPSISLQTDAQTSPLSPWKENPFNPTFHASNLDYETGHWGRDGHSSFFRAGEEYDSHKASVVRPLSRISENSASCVSPNAGFSTPTGNVTRSADCVTPIADFMTPTARGVSPSPSYASRNSGRVPRVSLASRHSHYFELSPDTQNNQVNSRGYNNNNYCYNFSDSCSNNNNSSSYHNLFNNNSNIYTPTKNLASDSISLAPIAANESFRPASAASFSFRNPPSAVGHNSGEKTNKQESNKELIIFNHLGVI